MLTYHYKNNIPDPIGMSGRSGWSIDRDRGAPKHVSGWMGDYDDPMITNGGSRSGFFRTEKDAWHFLVEEKKRHLARAKQGLKDCK